MERATEEAACAPRNIAVLGTRALEKWRISISVIYLLAWYTTTTPSTPAPPDKWDGKGGVVARVRKYARVPKGSTASVRKIISDAYMCWCEGEAYTGKQDDAGGHNKLIERGSNEERIAADAIENRLGYTVATELVNIYRVYEGEYTVNHPREAPPLLTAMCAGKTPVGRSSVYTAILRLIADGVGKTVRAVKRKQGDYDPTSKWARASFAWIAQLLIMLGQISPEEAMDDVLDSGKEAPWWSKAAPGHYDENDLPAYFDPAMLPTLNPNQVLFCDKKHRECKFHNGDNRKSCPLLVIFKRNESGEISASGAFDDAPEFLNVKYPKEVRFMQGYAAVRPIEAGVEKPQEGRRSEVFFYSEKQMISRKQTERMEKQEIACVRGLGEAAEDRRRGGWIKTNRA